MFEKEAIHTVKQGLASRLHRWNSNCSGRGLFTPHMKCYFTYRLVHTESINEKKENGWNDCYDNKKKNENFYEGKCINVDGDIKNNSKNNNNNINNNNNSNNDNDNNNNIDNNNDNNNNNKKKIYYHHDLNITKEESNQ